ncbi:MAG: FmdE family protein [Chloroflexota bacterium]
MAENPRRETEEMVAKGDLKGLWRTKASEFHGHACHKVAYGVKAGALALKELGIKPTREDTEGKVVAIVDSSGPFLNGVQVVTGLTVGTSHLVIRDIGKLALTLVKMDGSAVRVALRPEFLDGFAQRIPDLAGLMGGRYGTIPVPEGRRTPLTVMELMGYIMEKMGVQTGEDLQKIMEGMAGTLREAVMKELDVPDEQMFKVERKEVDFSQYAPICQCTCPVVVCQSCGEVVLEPYVRTKNRMRVCPECAVGRYSVLAKGRIAASSSRV